MDEGDLGVTDRPAALRRMLDSLDGLATGDAFGEQFFVDSAEAERLIAARLLTPRPWPWTDDTTMALVLVAILVRRGKIDQNSVAASFGVTYRADPHRGYGPGMHRLLIRYVNGSEWQELAPTMFGGQGSFGNGAAMRVAPVGAYFAGDLQRAAREASLSAVVTHTHPEAIAGAIGIAVGAALAAGTNLTGDAFLGAVLEVLPESEVRNRVSRAREMLHMRADVAARALGNGSEISAQDTVPFCLWAASRRIEDYEAALWETVSALGDRDTTCAMVGGIVAARVGRTAIPANWRSSRQSLPSWVHGVEPNIEP